MSDISNSKKYAPPAGYYERTSGRTSDLLVRAMGYLDDGARLALDLGCGAGGDTDLMARYGLFVTAVDANPESRQHIDKLQDQENIHFVQSDFEDFEFEEYDIINASHSLPFAHKGKFDEMFGRLRASLSDGGLFAGRLYGENDEWNKPEETMTFVSEAKARSLLEGLDIIYFDEREEEGTIANGAPKHWHVFDIIARKY